ncbi:MAG: hypothetical protein MPK75_13085, partial [Alphaproteobacteria bacterium]|nr:hypothetical protein [Alphaproteobacteria bacterium]
DVYKRQTTPSGLPDRHNTNLSLVSSVDVDLATSEHSSAVKMCLRLNNSFKSGIKGKRHFIE